MDKKLNKLAEKQHEENLLALERERQLQSIEANKTRAQSVNIGTAGGGITEITMRSAAGVFLWNTYQPVEVVELINQLAANIGCHIHIVPRQDFASWRDWKLSPEELAHARGLQSLPGVGFAPHSKTLFNEQYTGTHSVPLLDPNSKLDERKGTKLSQEEEENVATKKAVNKRTPKRSRSSSK